MKSNFAKKESKDWLGVVKNTIASKNHYAICHDNGYRLFSFKEQKEESITEFSKRGEHL